MGSISDTMLAGGCATHLENVHAELVTVLTGVNAGKKFLAINEIEQDINLTGELGNDPRGVRVLRFRNVTGNVPIGLNKLDRIRTADGRVWAATLQPGSSYLTVDYRLAEIVKGKDT